MRNDIYNRNPDDPNFAENELEMDDTLEMFKQQIESCLFTPKTTVMGSVNFGASLDEYIWSYRTSAYDLTYVINDQIAQFCTLGSLYPYKVDVKFYSGSIRDIAEISIVIDNGRDGFNVIVA